MPTRGAAEPVARTSDRPVVRARFGPRAESAEELDARFERDALAHLDRLYAAALRMTGRPDAAEELVQETYQRAYRVFHRIAPEADLRTCLLRIQHNTWLNSCAAEMRIDDAQTRRPHAGAVPGAGIEVLERLPDAVITEALAALPPELRITLYLADVEGCSYQEIVEITGAVRGVVMTRLFQARRRMRGALTEYALRSGLHRPLRVVA
ncbi:sigma-70 family RNA polymerase sigma factor [Yinghuangia seranimata]|uniref:sigma-70 family RNA polymerase sigma factor n=1 Tax=Yinghuangia seranimata TaxID=408067 RepID=UPI00248BEFC2|nr:sigma-70 family RNA polymerase sigma factor [Yinghuangia seranimata]MDI2127007.1 sigma-70 family RNA polymerase sigma factor [Yinghuangia seranimata]